MDPVYWSILLLALGFFAIGLELFIPSAGMLGVLAAGLLIAGVVCAFMQNTQTGTVVLLLTVLAIPVMIALMVRAWPHTPLGRMILPAELTANDVMPNLDEAFRLKELVGQLGVAKSKMLPSGLIEISGERFDAVSDGFPIELGDPVIVTSVRGNRIYVQRHDAELANTEDLPVRNRDVLATPIEDLGIDLSDSSEGGRGV